MKIAIINGPNLNLLGRREKGIYGERDFDSFMSELQSLYKDVEFSCFQSNSEGALIDRIQEDGFGKVDGIVLNAGAYTHTSVAISDAIRGIQVPVIEVHISNIAAREEYRHHSFIAAACRGSIAGFGLDSYRLAVEALLKISAR